MLYEFVTTYRDAIIDTTRVKVSARPGPAASSAELENGLPMFLTQLAETILEARRRRAEIFNPAMFGEPAWELLLTLFVMDREGPRLTIGRLAQTAGTKLTTALRWLEYLEDQMFVRREQHPNDARTAFIELTDKARDALRLYLSGTSAPNL